MADTPPESNEQYLSNIVAQGGMVRVDTTGKSGAELARLQQIEQERKKDAENLIREFLEQVSFDPYYRATLAKWYDDTDSTLTEKYPDQPGLAERIRKVLEGDTTDIVAAIKTRIAQIDELLQIQLDKILHTPEFQALEASWRGLHYLVDKSETGTHLKIRVLNATKADLVGKHGKRQDCATGLRTGRQKLYVQIDDCIRWFGIGARSEFVLIRNNKGIFVRAIVRTSRVISQHGIQSPGIVILVGHIVPVGPGS